MSLLFTIASVEGYVELSCSICAALVGRITLKEAGELSTNDIHPLCFDCDPGEADRIPSQLVDSNDHYLLGIGDAVFLAEWVGEGFMGNRGDLRMQKISHLTFFDLKTGWGPQYTPLSSSLNLHKISNVGTKFQRLQEELP